MRPLTLTAFAATALSLIACSGFVDGMMEKAQQDPEFSANFVESFLDKYHPGCIKAQMAGGADVVHAQAGCTCVEGHLAQLKPAELMRLATHAEEPASKQIFNDAHTECGLIAPL